MICPVCGATMNHHADKLEYSEMAGAPDGGGMVNEIYACPACGNVESLPGPDGQSPNQAPGSTERGG